MMMEGKATVTYQTNAVFSPNNAVGMADGNAGSSSQEDERGSAAAGFRRAETLLRLFPMALCVVALVLMLKNSQSNTDFGSISYYDVLPFKYLVHANGICAGYTLLSAVVAAIRRPFSMPRAWTFFLLDQVAVKIWICISALLLLVSVDVMEAHNHNMVSPV
ncbi:unnamed protein product [Cuscuta epithymum]|uniref:CASP-like protein n=1 Tax=Cuscuta epithymum TaxID=186058 RepID=A0AAV0D821_9ASTE|nr:unnamed protein product [Cuscuta epithymum]